jgi:hypothetical protein
MCTSAESAPIDRPEEDHRRLRFKSNIPIDIFSLCSGHLLIIDFAFSRRVEIIVSCPQANLEAHQDPTGTSHPHASDSVVSFNTFYCKVLHLAPFLVV